MTDSQQQQEKTPEDCLRQFLARYSSCDRHWNEESEPYTGVDSLLSMLNDGWTLIPMIAYEEHGNRLHHTVVYHICLERGLEEVTMCVINNPVTARFIVETAVWVVPIEDWQDIPDNPTWS